jgi:hypothetical protein
MKMEAFLLNFLFEKKYLLIVKFNFILNILFYYLKI